MTAKPPSPLSAAPRRRRLLAVTAALLAAWLLYIPGARAEEITVAVATNFLPALEALGRRFEASSGHRLRVSGGSTGHLYAQIRHGAPYDLFLAADAERPRLLEEQGLTVPGSRFTYAVGRLLLWSRNPRLIGDDGEALLRQGEFSALVIANPRLAPYGLAARQSLEALGLWGELQSRLVFGENIGQAWSMVATANAPLGLLALAQYRQPGNEAVGSAWLVPEHLHEPILQQAVLLRRAAGKAGARALAEFLRGREARELIEEFGYQSEPAA